MMAILAAGSAACFVFPAAAASPEAAPEIRLVWPSPPDPARIEYVGSISSAADLGFRKAWYERLWEFIAGPDDERMLRPFGLSAHPEKICVADPSAQAVHLFDRKAQRYRKVSTAGRTRLVSPVGVAIGPNGSIYVTDSVLAKIFVFNGSGRFVREIAGGGLTRPTGVAVDAVRGRLYVVDSVAGRVVAFDLDGTRLHQFGRTGTGPGEFNRPTHAAVNAKGDVYVVDTLNHRVQAFTPEGAFIGSFGRLGNGTGDFASPKGAAVDGRGQVYVVDALFDAVQVFDPGGRLLLVLGRQGNKEGEFWLPAGIAFDGLDLLYVADSYNGRIQIFRVLPERGSS
ncbi:MAG: SMP-30/gluconolactonase/LRE family protein [Nitrospirae bacterium]|nr:SMP-30/gluconolactonase/LRE family protein [Nitrospirota bacterium]